MVRYCWWSRPITSGRGLPVTAPPSCGRWSAAARSAGSVALCDERAVKQLSQLPVGARARLPLGGRGWPADPGPLEADVTLISRGSGAFQFEDPQNHLASAYGAGFDMGPCAVVQTAGVTILLTTHRTPPFDLGQFRSQGIQPERILHG